MDDQTSWTPGELPDPPPPPATPSWNTPARPGTGGPYGGSASSSGAPGYGSTGYGSSGYGSSGSGSSPYGSASRDPFFSNPSQGDPAAGRSYGDPGAAGPSYAAPAAPAAQSYATPAGPGPGPAYQASPYAPPASAPYGPPAPGAVPTYGAAGPLGYPASPTMVGFPGAAPPTGYGAPGVPYGAPYGPYQPYGGKPGFDGFAIAAFVLGLVGGWLLSFVFGPIALHRIKKNGTRGRGLAIAGMVVTAAWILLAVAIPVALNQRHHALHDACAGGDMTACDTLYDTSATGSADKEFGNTCGGRTDGGYLCTAIGDKTYGDDAHLDSLWDACAAGDPQSCDELSWSAQPGTDYALYGQTCGGRTDGSVDCVDAMGDAAGQQT